MQTVCNTYWDAGKGNLTAQNTRKPFGGRGSAPDPAEGAYSAPANLLVGGEGLAVPSPRTPYPHSKISSDAVAYVPKITVYLADSQRAFVCCWSRFCLQSCVLSSSHALKVHYRWSEQFNFDRFKKICVILVWMSLSWWAVRVGEMSP